MRIVCLPAHNPGPLTGAGNNTYLLVGSSFDSAQGRRRGVLIDAGEGKAQHLDDIQRALDEANTSLALVLVTHGHVDHVSGCEAIAARWPDVEFAKMPWPDRDGRYRVRWTPIHDNQFVGSDETTLRAIHTPGHSPDHVCLIEEATGTVFCGDLLQKHGTVVIPPSAGGSLAQYLASLQRLVTLRPQRLLPAHGPAIDDPLPMIERTVAHRRTRERHVLAAVRAGHDTVEKVVGAVYAGLEPALSNFAHETALAHLIKLEEEGRVKRDRDGAWTEKAL